MRLRIPLVLFFSLAGFALAYYLFFQQTIDRQFLKLGGDHAVIEARPSEHAPPGEEQKHLQGYPKEVREAISRARAALDFGFASVLAVGSFILLALWLALELWLVRPLSSLTGEIHSIRADKDLSRRLPAGLGGEIGSLASAFNEMMDEIEQARGTVLDQSFRLGMAEMASGVLHNVRNSLTPFAGHLQLAKRALEEASLADMARAAEELSRGEGDSKRRADLTAFLALAAADAKGRFAAAVEKLDKLALVTKKIESILVEQGRSGQARRQAETLPLSRLMREALTLVPEGYLEFMDIETGAELAGAPPVLGNAVILQQVFANLACNAAEAAARNKLRKIRLRVSAAALPGGDAVEVALADDGPGFDPELKDRIFERGFSSKEVSSGLGLHWCANVVAAMGGSIRAHSDGPGRGASFTVVLPVRSAA